MHKINIVAVGTLKEDYWKGAINEYMKRLKRFASVEIKEVPEFASSSRVSVEKVKEEECLNIEKQLSGFVISMDKSGKQLSSDELAKFIDNTFSSGAKTITFVIGGSNGLTSEFIKKTDGSLSFGKITYPHQLMRVVLLEQLYRAETILNNISYHK